MSWASSVPQQKGGPRGREDTSDDTSEDTCGLWLHGDACGCLGLTGCLTGCLPLPVKHQGGACRRAHPPQTAYCRDRWMAAEESRKRIRVSQQFSSGAPEPAPHPFPNPLGDNDTRKIRRIHKAFLAEKENSPLGSEEQDAWVNAIMEEQAARSARSRRKVIEDFHCVCGW